MKILLTSLLIAAPLAAQVPTASHEIFGSIRNSLGVPLTNGAFVSLSSNGNRIVSGVVDSSIAPGRNYSVQIPMVTGEGTATQNGTALATGLPFTMSVLVGGQTFVPMEFQGSVENIGVPGARTRVDLTLGIDSDEDGLPDAWEQEIIDTVPGISSLSDVTPEGDADNDGLTNRVEYIVGTYAFDRQAVLRLEVMEVDDGIVKLQFLAAKGRTYSVQSSPTLANFTMQSFSRNADGSSPQVTFLSDRIQFVTIYVAEDVNTTAGSFYNLLVE